MELDEKQLLHDGLRIDGRRPLEVRKISVRLGVFGQADGSAYIEQGKTKALATVYGPHQPRGSAARSTTKTTKGIVNCQYSTAVFSFGAGERKKRPRGDRKSLERALQLRHAMEAIIQLELIARSQIDIFIEMLQVDGSEFCVAVNAATMALIDAGIPIRDYAVGCSVTITDSVITEDDKGAHGVGLLDANYVEEGMPGVTLSVVSLPGLAIDVPIGNSVVVVQGSGQRLHLSRLEGLRMRAVHGCRDIRAILDEAVREHLNIYSIHTIAD